MASYDQSWIRWSVAQVARSAEVAKRVVGGLVGGEDASGVRLDEEMVVMDILKVVDLAEMRERTFCQQAQELDNVRKV